jgi:holo-[acyl-carrier protein] synthase
MIVGVGVDLFEVARMEHQLRQGGAAFREELFTPGEIAYCETKRCPARHYAARFAAKEAVLKALAQGQPPEGRSPDRGRRDGWTWREVEVRSEGGPPSVVLHGSLHARAQALHVGRILLSLSHTRELAMANVVLES